MFDFDMLGLNPALKAALDRMKFSQPTPIQAQAIPLAMDGHDIMGLAQTGTGKTLAFGLPLLDMLLAVPGKPAPITPKALILAPTRELVNQIADSLANMAQGTKLRIVTVVGGQSITKQMQALKRGCDVLVATPGRLIDLMERKAVILNQVGYLVLDEADQMLDMGFGQALQRIEPALGTPRQTMLFSATMSKPMEKIAATYLTNPRKVQVSQEGKAADSVEQSVHIIAESVKNEVLREALNQDRDATTLVFVRTKFGTEKLMKALRSEGYNADSIHGNKSQSQRDRAIKAFRDGKTTILCATDVAARGIDIPEVARVINLNLPEQPDSYVHRIGRTGRAGRSGIAISLCSTTEVPLLRDIEKLMKMEIPVASGAELLRNLEPPKGAAPKKSGSGRRRFGGGGGGGKPDGAKRPHRGGGGRKFGSEGGKRTEGRKKSA